MFEAKKIDDTYYSTLAGWYAFAQADCVYTSIRDIYSENVLITDIPRLARRIRVFYFDYFLKLYEPLPLETKVVERMGEKLERISKKDMMEILYRAYPKSLRKMARKRISRENFKFEEGRDWVTGMWSMNLALFHITDLYKVCITMGVQKKWGKYLMDVVLSITQLPTFVINTKKFPFYPKIRKISPSLYLTSKKIEVRTRRKIKEIRVYLVSDRKKNIRDKIAQISS